MNRKIIAIISDTHSGFRDGLQNPDTVLYDEDEDGNLIPFVPGINRFQEAIWKTYLEIIEKVVSIANGDEIALIHLGDGPQGIKHIDDVVSAKVSDHILLFKGTLNPWYLVPNLKTVRLVGGTGAHEFGEGSAAVLVAEFLAKEYPAIDTKAVFHGVAGFGNGENLDYSHHGPSDSIRIWLSGNSARYYLKDRVIREIMSGKNPAKIYVRGHVHPSTPVWETVHEWVNQKIYTASMLTVPALCGLSGYARTVAKSPAQIMVGAIVLESTDMGISVLEYITRQFDIRTKEIL
jgi:hypothetical protein